ncbi:hypothetical protein J6590_051831 [Homalodisca vitripennis]|nr:hypothetical protein J6590_051831 [Homalodisca vitripennis]
MISPHRPFDKIGQVNFTPRFIYPAYVHVRDIDNYLPSPPHHTRCGVTHRHCVFASTSYPPELSCDSIECI